MSSRLFRRIAGIACWPPCPRPSPRIQLRQHHRRNQVSDTVTITGVDTGFRRELKIDRDGKYQVRRVPTGDYQVVRVHKDNTIDPGAIHRGPPGGTARVMESGRTGPRTCSADPDAPGWVHSRHTGWMDPAHDLARNPPPPPPRCPRAITSMPAWPRSTAARSSTAAGSWWSRTSRNCRPPATTWSPTSPPADPRGARRRRCDPRLPGVCRHRAWPARLVRLASPRSRCVAALSRLDLR